MSLRFPYLGAISPLRFLPAALVAAGCCAPVAAVPPPPEQSAANCSTPTYASDQLVCADPALLALDRRMVDLLAGTRSAAWPSAAYWFEPQAVWFRRRSLCAFSARHAACLRSAYRERIDLLTVLAGRAAAQARPILRLRCPGAPWGSGPVRLHGHDQAGFTIEDGLGAVLVVASSLQPRDDWSPILRIVPDEGGIRLEPLGDTGVRCRVVQDRRPGQVAPQGNRPE